MAKGRRHGAELLFVAPPRSGDATDDLPDLEEDDVWLALQDDDDDHKESSDVDAADGGRAPVRLLDRLNRRRWGRPFVGGLTLAFEDVRTGALQAGYHPSQQLEGNRAAASVPVNVPVWPKWLLSGSPAEREVEEQEEEEESGGGEWMPPHEYLVRARRWRAATSVLEGVGRTLKGRDMSRVRDAVWSQTGFPG